MAPNWTALTALWVIVVVLAAAATDLWKGKVYNVLTVPAAGAGLTMAALATGWPGVLHSLQGVGLGFLFLFATIFLGQCMGGGDIKLLGALGALRGPSFLLWTLLFAILAGGLMAVVLALWRRELLASLRRLGCSLQGRFVTGIAPDSASLQRSVRLPYAVAIAAGSVVALCWL